MDDVEAAAGGQRELRTDGDRRRLGDGRPRGEQVVVRRDRVPEQLGGASQDVPVLAVRGQQTAAPGDLAEHLEDLAVLRRQQQGLGRSGGEVVDQPLGLLVERRSPRRTSRRPHRPRAAGRSRPGWRGRAPCPHRPKSVQAFAAWSARRCSNVATSVHRPVRRSASRGSSSYRRTERPSGGVVERLLVGVPRVAGVDVRVDEPREHQEPGGVDPLVRLDRGAAVDPGLDDAVVAQQVGLDQTLRGDAGSRP